MELVLTILCFTFLSGILISFLYYVPLTLYSIPYILWLASQHLKGEYKDISPDKGALRDARNATKVYLSFFTRKKPVLK